MLNKLNRWLLTLFLSFGLLTAASANLDLKVPDLSEIGGRTSHQAGYQNQLSLKVLRQFRNHRSVVEDPELSSWLRGIGNRLVSQSGYRGNVYFLLANNSEVNAFATMGGVIVINTGLILHADSESELAAVIAHEIAHVSQKHLDRLVANSKGSVLGTSAAVLAGILAGTQDSQAGSAIIATALAAQQHRQLDYSRSMESEADSVGIRTLARAGFKASGMPLFMEKLDRLSNGRYAQLSKFLQSHPLSIERVGNTRAWANQLGNSGRDGADFAFIKEKVRSLTARGGQKVQFSELSNQQVKNYAQALQLTKMGQYLRAQTLLKQSGNQKTVKLALAESYSKQSNYTEAAKILQALHAKHYGEEAVLIPLVDNLLVAGQRQKAWNTVKGVVASEQTSLGFYEVKQEAARAVGLTGEAYLAAADRNIRLAEYQHAKTQLRAAQRIPNISGGVRARIDAKLKHIDGVDKPKQ
ncbi:MAG: Putative Zn-dependent protease, contains TPR repeats [uncultured Thiotrichaceae bacterium]|uniref:Zn-dependent protease, contains TPR repeats n=1 Tax=uncultured Thiotrichaceae bacterium TaxID=298394 RepID=A0A6S6U1J8_9GAMM|nr:MAG: Putative Zn-dependent protease, contains TPR repeats [uncultured Thiotrichaceae bacterium]